MKSLLRRHALELGFDRVAFCRADAPLEGADFLESWLAAGRHGSMRYLAHRPRDRADAANLLPGARTVVVVACAYPAAPAGSGGIASYARVADYHRAMGERLERLLAYARTLDPRVRGRVAVDTKPLLERRAAAAAGIGWIGKNTMLLDVEHGPWLLLGELLVDVALEPDEPAKDRCGTCTRCLVACPTAAFVAPYELDARRCLSYWSIEHRGAWPAWIREAFGTRIFGCDDCLTACPFGRDDPPARAARLLDAAPELAALKPAQMLDRLERGFGRHFRRFALERAGRAGLLRNVLTALGNGGDQRHARRVRAYLRDRNDGVRVHAAWALGRIGSLDDAPALRAAIALEEDDRARAEQLAALLELEARCDDANG